MDLIRLSPDTHLPEKPIESYSSLIWSERYSNFGDFELRTAAIDDIQEDLPIGSFVSLMDVDEVMRVESYTKSISEQGVHEIIVRGRSALAIMEKRTPLPWGWARQEPWRTRKALTPTESALALMWNTLKDAWPDAIGAYNVPDEGPPPLGSEYGTAMMIPNIFTTDSTGGNYGASKRRWIEPDYTWPQVKKMIDWGRLGIRTVRPPTFKIPIWIDPDNNFVRGANIERELLCFDVYRGRNRENVVFRLDMGDLGAVEYLYDHQTRITVGRGSSDSLTVADAILFTTGYSASNPPQGWEYQEVLVSTPSRPDGITNSEFSDMLKDEVRGGMKKMNAPLTFQAEAADVSRHIFRKHYDLGDLVTVQTDFGDMTMAVSEYIRTSDAEGERAYPTFEMLS